jgi:signal transduction histidine kinase
VTRVDGVPGSDPPSWPAPGTSGPATAGGDPLGSPLFESLLDALGAASLGDLGSRADVAPDALDDPLELVANAVNMLLDDLAYRQSEREDALRKVSAAEAKEEFLASLSHDMQTPLAIILGAIHVLDATNSPEHLESTLPLMRAAAHRLQRFVQQFLDLARLEAHEILMVRSTTVDVPNVVERTIALFVEYASITVDVPETLPPVVADPERVEQILANLLSNAFNYASTPSVTVRPKATRGGDRCRGSGAGDDRRGAHAGVRQVRADQQPPRAVGDGAGSVHQPGDGRGAGR